MTSHPYDTALDDWHAGWKRASFPARRLWIFKSWLAERGWGDKAALARSNPAAVLAYSQLAHSRRESRERHKSLDAMDAFWISNEIMGISLAGTAPVQQACDRLVQAAPHIHAAYAPMPHLPRVDELLLEWCAWFDDDFLNEPERRACAMAQRALATLESQTLLHDTPARPPASSEPRRL
jgi:hypothetical protein